MIRVRQVQYFQKGANDIEEQASSQFRGPRRFKVHRINIVQRLSDIFRIAALTWLTSKRLEFDRIVIMMLDVAYMPEVNDRISSAEHTVIQGGHGFEISAPIVPFPVYAADGNRHGNMETVLQYPEQSLCNLMKKELGFRLLNRMEINQDRYPVAFHIDGESLVTRICDIRADIRDNKPNLRPTLLGWLRRQPCNIHGLNNDYGKLVGLEADAHGR